VTFPLGGEFSQSAREWAGYGDFLLTLTRWLEGDKAPAGATLRHTVDGSGMVVEFLHDETWLERLAKAPPRLLTSEGTGGATKEVTWEKMAPGRYRAQVELPPGRWMRGAVLAGGFALPFGPVAAAVNPEWEEDTARVESLRAVSAASGGVERIDLPAVWRAERRASWEEISVWLLIAWGVLFLMEALQTRTGFGEKNSKP
jgi:hypothetical protein